METYKVFVYGTLLVGESNHYVAKPFLQHIEPGVIKGYLYNVGPYPALIAAEKGMEIHGEWFTVNEEGLQAMDQLEGYQEGRNANYYDRVWVKDCYNKNEGFVYVFKKEQVINLDLIECGSWRAFRKQNGGRLD